MCDFDPPDYLTVTIVRLTICAELHDTLSAHTRVRGWLSLATMCGTVLGFGVSLVQGLRDSALGWGVWGVALSASVAYHRWMTAHHLFEASEYRRFAWYLNALWLGDVENVHGLAFHVRRHSETVLGDRFIQRALRTDDGFRERFERGTW